MRILSNKLNGRAIISVLLATIVLLCPFFAMEISSKAVAPQEGLVHFEDDFNRADGDINNNNSWVSQGVNATTGKSPNKIEDNTLVIDDSTTNGVCTRRVSRPMSEATLNQFVSVEILNAGDLVDHNEANIHLRLNFTSVGTSDLSYYVELTNQQIAIRKTTANWTDTALSVNGSSGGGSAVKYSNVYGHKYRVEFTAQGMLPTTLIAQLYDVTDNNKLVATVTGTDDTSGLQRYGTAALSVTGNSAGQTRAKFDNFVYRQTDTMVCYDDFNRENNAVGNNWIGSKSEYTQISNNVLKFRTDPINNNSNAINQGAIVRPMTESKLNQLVEVEFQRSVVTGDVGAVVIARADSETITSNNCYKLATVLGVDGSGNWNNRLYLEGASGTKLIDSRVSLDPRSKYKLQLSVRSISDEETELIASLYDITNGKSSRVYQRRVVDNDPSLQREGTAGFSAYSKWGGGIDVFGFSYTEPQEATVEEQLPEDDAIPVYFSDDFDDKSGAINGVNDWIDQQFLLKGENIATVKNGKLVIDNGTKTDTGAYTNKIMRPMSEATLNQYVSLDIENLEEIKGVEVDLRLIEIPADSEATSNRHAMYGCSVTKTSLAIVTRLGWSQGEMAIGRWEYKEGHKYRLEATALGSLPTTITATLYDLTENGEIVATVTAKDESINTANHRTTQIPGTVGISYAGEKPVKIDNFIYKQTDTVACHDSFNRKGGKPGNDWVIGSGSQKTVISSAKLVMNNGGVDDMWSTALTRPLNENSIDQYVGIEFQRPDGMGNLSAPIVFARSQTATSVTVDGKQGFATYYAQVTFTGEWSSKISIYKVGNDGVITLLKEGTVNDYGGGSTGKAKLQLIAEGNNPTKLTVILYVLSETRHYKVYNATVYDNQPELQNAGTTGVSYSGTTKTFTVNRFSYFIPQEQPDEPLVPEDLAEDYMAYFSGTVASGEFGQWIELEPNKTYIYTVKIKKILNSGGFATRVQYNPQNLGRVYRDATLLSHTYDEETFVEMIEFTVPKEAHIQHNGKARIKIVVHEGGLGSVGYATDFKVYEKDDAEQKNLLINPDFKKGLYAWCGHGEVQGVSEANVLVTKTRGEVQLVKYDPLAFVRDDSDIYFDDGNWAENFETVNYDGDSGKVSGRLVDILKNPIPSATVSLSDTLTVKTDKNGEFTFTNLPADIYFLSVTLSNGKMAEFDEIIDVKEDSEINIELTFEEETEDFEFDDEEILDEIIEPETDDESSNDNQKENSNNKSEDKKTNANKKTENDEVVLLPWIIAGAAAVCIAGLAVLIIVLIRKKRK